MRWNIYVEKINSDIKLCIPIVSNRNPLTFYCNIPKFITTIILQSSQHFVTIVFYLMFSLLLLSIVWLFYIVFFRIVLIKFMLLPLYYFKCFICFHYRRWCLLENKRYYYYNNVLPVYLMSCFASKAVYIPFQPFFLSVSLSFCCCKINKVLTGKRIKNEDCSCFVCWLFYSLKLWCGHWYTYFLSSPRFIILLPFPSIFKQ